MSDSRKSKILRLLCSSGMVFTNFLTTLYIARSLGFNEQLDVYYLTLAMYFYLMTAIGWALSNVLTPVFIKHEDKYTLGSVLATISLMLSPLILIIVSLKGNIISVVYTNYIDDFSNSDLEVYFFLAIIMFIIDLISTVLISFENAKSRFNIPIFINFLASLLGLMSAYFYVKYYGVLGAILSQVTIKTTVVLILSFLNYQEFKETSININIAKDLFRKTKYFIFSGVYFRTDDLLEKYIASYFNTGQLSLVSFIQRIYGAIITVVNTVIITPTLTKFCKNKNNYESMELIKKLSLLILSLGILGYIVTHFLGVMVIKFLFPEQISILEEYLHITLVLLYPTCVFLVLSQLIHNYLLSLELEKNISYFDIFSFTISAALKIVLTIQYGYVGFLLGIMGTSIATLCFKTYLLLYSRKFIIKEGCNVK